MHRLFLRLPIYKSARIDSNFGKYIISIIYKKNQSDNQVDLYNFVFPPSADARGLAVIGLVQPIGSVAPISEMQARWAAAVFAGRLQLPNEGEMRAAIAARRCQMRRQYFESSKHTLQVK